MDATGNCVSCNPPKFWDATSLSCLDCTSGNCMGCPPTFYPRLNPSGTSGSAFICGCPEDSPYISAINTCMSCPINWNPTDKTCNGCDHSFTYDSLSKQCVCPKGTNLNAKKQCMPCPLPGIWDTIRLGCMQCPVSFAYNMTSGVCYCPPETPYVNSNSVCVSCVAPNFWDTTRMQCLTCTNGMVIDAATLSCQCPSNLPNYDGVNCYPTCPQPTPFWNGKSCVGCPPGSFSEPGSTLCFQCPPGTVYRSDHNPCCAALLTS
jgi:hypothetical protein